MRNRTIRSRHGCGLAAAVVVALLLMVAAPAPATAAVARGGPLPEQPDGLVGKNGTVFAGDGIYNTTGAGQTMTRNAARGTTVHFFVEIQNDGDGTPMVHVRGCGSNSSFKVRYFSSPMHTDNTASFVDGFDAPMFVPGVSPRWQVDVKVKSSAPAGAVLNCKLRLSITDGETTLRDTVAMVVRRS